MGWVFALNAEAFRVVSRVPQGLIISILIVLFAGLSQAIAQSIILFINKVQPLRFVFSLLINALLFVAGFLFLVFSTWLITLLPGTVNVSLITLIKVLGISYATLVFSFLGALPYLGLPLLSLLSVWHLLALVVGFSAVTEIAVEKGLGYVVFGWIVLQILQQTVGRPLANFGRWLSDTVAGVDLSTRRRDVNNLVQTRAQQSSSVWQEQLRERITEIRQTPYSSEYNSQTTVTETKPQPASTSTATFSQLPNRIENRPTQTNKTVKTILGLFGIAILTYIIIIFLRPIREWWFGWYTSLPTLFRLTFKLVWIGVIALVVAGLLAPLETLGWWAGWYDDQVDTTVNAVELAEPVADPQTISRYIVYLDGIGKSTFEYLPDIEEFLNTLAPALPDDMALIRGIMPYSVLNNPLDQDRPLAFLWKLVEKSRLANPASVLGLLINIRNVLIVGVSADKRYGPLYNQGIAQVVYNGLVKNGYRLNSSIPITLIGYSGGGQMSCACAPFLKRAISAPIDVISLGGVISGNCNILKLEHLYHLVGDEDGVEQIGPIMFPGRWKIFPLSYWNRAKRRGKTSIFSMGPVGHQVPGGILDPDLTLSDGHSSLEQTINYIKKIVQGNLLPKIDLTAVQASNYELYRQAEFTRPDYYPIDQTVNSHLYKPIGTWMGRLILPKLEERSQIRGVLFEVHHADTDSQHLVGQVVKLRWADHPQVQKLVKAVTQDVHFSADAEYTSKYGGLVHPVRLNHWQSVDPLESLAGSHPVDDLIIMLEGGVTVEEEPTATSNYPVTLRIYHTPIQITGRYYGLIQFVRPISGTDQFRVVHFNPISRQFDGFPEQVRLPEVIQAPAYGSYPSTTHKIEQSPLNETGWYIYGAKDANGQFVVQSLAPRSLLRLQANQVRFEKSADRYIRKEAWDNIVAQKGQISSVLCLNHKDESSSAIQNAIADWQEGDRALLLHSYGGIGGKNKEPAASTPIFFGHFAYGVAEVIRDPLASELRFEISYHQVYTHNTDGLIAGTLHWSRYVGDRQFGWLGTRPICDILVKLDAFTGDYNFDGVRRSPLTEMLSQLEVMTARYRIGDGTGGTYVGPANNCSQDSNRALFASIQNIKAGIESNQDWLKNWASRHPQQAEDFNQLIELGIDLKRQLQPFGQPRSDWENQEYNLGTTLEDEPLRNLAMGLSSWRTLLPRKASDTVVQTFLKYNACVWVLRTNQIGGYNPNIEPIAPITL
ncbi:putative membrane protein [Lyngbya aestuarii BL J]|uniref:Putative membrane protein n=1 Tax=Lyngbya aestuarii BL J TaxID=1348334 RepID=U7QG27_9CYAN|nr:putative membrane protein [Lyngbya aestuarii BL J]